MFSLADEVDAGSFDFFQLHFSQVAALQVEYGCFARDHLECCEYMNVMDYLTVNFPPAFVMTGEFDFLKLQNHQMDKALSRLNLPHVFKSYGNAETKEISHVFHVNMKLPLAHLCNDEECEFFKENTIRTIL